MTEIIIPLLALTVAVSPQREISSPSALTHVRDLRADGSLAKTETMAESHAYPISPDKGGRENTEWFQFYSFHVRDKDKDLPRVLLIGDSITQSIRGKVEKALAGQANVTYWISSYGIARPEYGALLEIVLRTHRYDVIHFNNGLHLCGTTEANYGDCLEKSLELVRKLQPQAKLVWSTCTPLRDHPGKCYVTNINATGRKVAEKFKVEAINDLYALANGFKRPTDWRDECHFMPEAQRRLADQTVSVIRPLLGRTKEDVTK